MNSAQTEFLGWKIAPARLNASQAAWYLGFEPHEITILIGDGMLKPLGHPARNSTKFFATETLHQLRRDEKWLARATLHHPRPERRDQRAFRSAAGPVLTSLRPAPPRSARARHG